MRSDYIVPEASKPHVVRPGKWIALAVVGVGLALYLARDAGDTAAKPASDTVHASVVTLSADATKSSIDFLGELSPLGDAHAMSREPLGETVKAEIVADTAALTIESIAPPAIEKNVVSRVVTVKSGDALSSLFERNKLHTADWMALARLKGDAKRLLRLHPGDALELELDEDDAVQALSLRLDALSTLHIVRNESGSFDQLVSTDDVETREVSVTGTINSSLFLAAKAAGLSDRLTMELTEIFAWDVDFALDIRVGDSFRVIYEEIYRDGEKLKDGSILAAEFINRGDSTRALRYTDEAGRDGYYSPAGEPMQKAFLRSPLDFTRISSRFSLGRKHPILNKIRAHKGVDYAAPRGTPIKSAGAGKVIFAGRKGGYGNVLIVQHAGRYKTLYAHLQNFRRGIRRGSSVDQGQVIAYVGSSGLATGPHLHYEFQVDNTHVNPLTVRLPSAPTIAANKIERFKSQTAELLAKLDMESEPNTTELAAAH